MEKENFENYAQRLSDKIDNALNKTKKNIPEKKKDIEYFFSFENNKVIYYFLVPGAKKEDLKLIIENDSENHDYVNVILTKNTIFKNFKFAQRLGTNSFMERKVEKISLVKESFDFNNVEFKLYDGILELAINIKNKKESEEFFIVRF